MFSNLDWFQRTLFTLVTDAVRGGIKGTRKDGATVRIQGAIYKEVEQLVLFYGRKILIGDRGDDQGPGGVPPPGGARDQGDEGETWSRRRVVVPTGSVFNGSHGAPTNRPFHQEAAGYHMVMCGLLLNL